MTAPDHPLSFPQPFWFLRGGMLPAQADAAMQAAKESGTGSCRFFEPSLARQLVTRLIRATELKLDVHRGELAR